MTEEEGRGRGGGDDVVVVGHDDYEGVDSR